MGANAAAKFVLSLVTLGAMVTGGYMDIENNTREPSTEGSNPEIVAKYEKQIKTLSEFTGDKASLTEESVNFFTAAYTDKHISESDVASLTDMFAINVMPPATLAGGYVLEHPEYLEECRADNTARNLGALDQCTLSQHEENYDDGPWLGVLGGYFAGNIFGGLALQLTLLTVIGGVLATEATAKGSVKLAEKAKKKVKEKLKKKPKHGRW